MDHTLAWLAAIVVTSLSTTAMVAAGCWHAGRQDRNR